MVVSTLSSPAPQLRAVLFRRTRPGLVRSSRWQRPPEPRTFPSRLRLRQRLAAASPRVITSAAAAFFNARAFRLSSTWACKMRRCSATPTRVLTPGARSPPGGRRAARRPCCRAPPRPFPASGPLYGRRGASWDSAACGRAWAQRAPRIFILGGSVPWARRGGGASPSSLRPGRSSS